MPLKHRKLSFFGLGSFRDTAGQEGFTSTGLPNSRNQRLSSIQAGAAPNRWGEDCGEASFHLQHVICCDVVNCGDMICDMWLCGSLWFDAFPTKQPGKLGPAVASTPACTCSSSSHEANHSCLSFRTSCVHEERTAHPFPQAKEVSIFGLRGRHCRHLFALLDVSW